MSLRIVVRCSGWMGRVVKTYCRSWESQNTTQEVAFPGEIEVHVLVILRAS
jgi:hypothetical protein